MASAPLKRRPANLNGDEVYSPAPLEMTFTC
jgi:hypothetical protein